MQNGEIGRTALDAPPPLPHLTDDSIISKDVPQTPAIGASFYDWKTWVWRLGMVVATSPECRRSTSDLIHDKLVSAQFSEDEISALWSSYHTACQRCRKPPSAPERVAACIRWFEAEWGIVRTEERIGRSNSYPRLMLFAYCMGRDMEPFTFAAKRIGDLCGADPRTVANFTGTLLKEGLLIEVARGTSGKKGRPSWYRIDDLERWRDILALDRRQLSTDGTTFDQHLSKECPFLFPRDP